MNLTNPWLGYLSRSYRTIKSSLLNRLSTIAPEIKDLSEGNILVIILTMFAGLGEQLHYYIDNWGRESYLATCRLFSSAVKLTQILDYRVKASLPAFTDLYFTYVDSDGNPVTTIEDGIIPVGTNIKTQNGVNFSVTKNITIPAGSSFGVVPVKQWVKVLNQTLGNTTNLSNQTYDLPSSYANNSLEITINAEVWTRQKTLARSLATDKHFIVDVSVDAIPYVKFGNGVKGQIPNAGFDIIGSFYTTDGKAGNKISPNTITQLDSSLTLPYPSLNVKITNSLNPIGGYDIESVEDIRNNAPLTIRTLDRAVTAQDYTDMALQADSVVKAKTLNSCGKNLQIYIAPAGGGIASSGLISDTKAFMEEVKMITTHLDVLAAGITPVFAKMLVTARFRADKIQCKTDCDNALGTRFSFDNQDINGRIALSDVIALIDNLDKVDTIELQAMYTLPYPFPQSPSTIALDWTRNTLANSNTKITWKLVYTGTDFRLYKNGAYLVNVPVNVVYTDPLHIISFRINPAMYSVSDTWVFTSYPYLTTINLDDNTIPIILTGQTTNITVV